MEDKKPVGLKARQSIQSFMTESRKLIFDSDFDEEVLELVDINVELSNLHPIFDDYKIINLSDIHLGQWISPKYLRGIVKYVNKFKPDMITLTGDYVSYILDGYEDVLLDSFSKLKAKDVKIAILGNHDHWTDPDKIREILKKSDIIDVSNNVYTLNKFDRAEKFENLEPILHIAGVDSVQAKKNDFNKVMSLMPKKNPAILLSHEPDFAKISSSTGRFGLQISGHSHGGQFIIPGINTTFIRGPHFTKFPVGEYKINDMIQYTSKGIGTNIFWFRVNCNPEITLFTLKSKKKVNINSFKEKEKIDVKVKK